MLPGVGRVEKTELEQSLARMIMQRTWGRVHRLQVDVVDGRIVVRGHAASYHAKQLALQAVLEVLGGTGTNRIDLAIEVGPPVRLAASRHFDARSATA